MRLSKQGKDIVELALMVAFCVAIAWLCFGTASCASVRPSDRQGGASVELLGGAQRLTSSGPSSLEGVGDVGTLELSGCAAADPSTGARPEAWVQAGRIDARDVDAGDLGLFDATGELVRAGIGVRSGEVGSVFGLRADGALGLCLTAVRGTASAGDESRRVSEGGAGLYGSIDVGLGPIFVRARYVWGPTVQDQGIETRLGGVELEGGLRWDL